MPIFLVLGVLVVLYVLASSHPSRRSLTRPPDPTTRRGGRRKRREAPSLVHLLPQDGRDVVVVHVRPVRAEAVRVVSPDVRDGLAVEGHVGGRLLGLLALGGPLPLPLHRHRGQARRGGRDRTADGGRRRHPPPGAAAAGAAGGRGGGGGSPWRPPSPSWPRPGWDRSPCPR